jgi:hypothetical protein
MSVHPTIDGDGSVLATFRLPTQVRATTVHVVGEFNDWSKSAHPMDTDDQGFIARVPLQPGRRYRFRYLIDGERWENDWAADDYVDNDFGGTDSVLDLTDAGRTEPAPVADVANVAPDGSAADGTATVEPPAAAGKARSKRRTKTAASPEATP